jgi:hypothetical protein
MSKVLENLVERAEMEQILRKHGYDPKDATKLLEEGMGPHELEHRIRSTKSGQMGSLEYTHRMKKLDRPEGSLARGPQRSSGTVDGGLIRRALRDVHLSEKSHTNPKGHGRAQAAAHAIANHGLSSEETDILLHGLSIRPDEKSAILAHAKRLRFKS